MFSNSFYVMMTVFRYIFTFFALAYGIFTAYEDLKNKEIHTFPIMVLNFIGFILCILDQKKLSNEFTIVLAAALLLMMFFDRVGWWGSGDTKMAFEGLILSVWWLKPTSVYAIIFLVLSYMLISSLIGLITVIIKRDVHPPMGHSFLITNVIALITAFII